MSFRGLRMDGRSISPELGFTRWTNGLALLSPVAISVIAFALGYQVRSYFAPTAPTLRSSSSTPTPGPKDPSLLDLTDKPPKAKSKNPKKIPSPATSSASDSESEAEVDTDSEAEDLALALSSNPQSLKPTAFDEVKLVLVVNDSLHMTKGKIAAQAGHATLGCALMMKEINPRMYKHWERHGWVFSSFLLLLLRPKLWFRERLIQFGEC
jgi:PTH2 family peptidyl-tRNA hydrolase